ncbi:MAG: phosphatase PAP2 family protein [Candidatus Kapabacteria bacterium]|nr:phosphatase PAP2 family protein [Candidatus Kapabacteria bacterium]
MLFLFALIGNFGGYSTDIYAQSPDSVKNARQRFVVWHDLECTYCDGKQLISGISGITPTQWYVSAGVVGGITALVVTDNLTGLDQHFRDIALRSQGASNHDIFSIANEYGNTATGVVIGGGIYTSGLVFGDESVRTTGRLVFESLIIAGISTTVLKGVIGRARPYTNTTDRTYKPLSFSNDYYSLPSGHSTVAFAVSTVLSERIGNVYASIGLYALAGSAAMGRMYFDKHWLTDVLLGGFIGTVSGIAVVRANERCTQSKSKTSSQLFLYPTAHGVGLTYSW